VGNNLIAVGNLNESRPAIRSVVELCILKHATAVAIIHNHPNGGLTPSQADIDFTATLERELDVIGVKLVEHIILDSKGYLPILKELRENGSIDVIEFK
jgi:DNA repair protein RadC